MARMQPSAQAPVTPTEARSHTRTKPLARSGLDCLTARLATQADRFSADWPDLTTPGPEAAERWLADLITHIDTTVLARHLCLTNARGAQVDLLAANRRLLQQIDMSAVPGTLGPDLAYAAAADLKELRNALMQLAQVPPVHLADLPPQGLSHGASIGTATGVAAAALAASWCPDTATSMSNSDPDLTGLLGDLWIQAEARAARTADGNMTVEGENEVTRNRLHAFALAPETADALSTNDQDRTAFLRLDPMLATGPALIALATPNWTCWLAVNQAPWSDLAQSVQTWIKQGH